MEQEVLTRTNQHCLSKSTKEDIIKSSEFFNQFIFLFSHLKNGIFTTPLVCFIVAIIKNDISNSEVSPNNKSNNGSLILVLCEQQLVN